MVSIDGLQIRPETEELIKNLNERIEKFREDGPLDKVALEKLQDHFKTSHIYHSAGIEGNKLTLKETLVVLQQGITISEKPIKESVEVKNLGLAYDFFFDLAQEETSVSENYLRQVHTLIVGGDEYLQAGNYRNIGVIITGSEHTPPEPFEIPIRMRELMSWIDENIGFNPVLVSAIAHHELAKIHPFVDGNGRTARLLLNFILLKRGYPICNLKREDRPKYYEAMSQADEGEYDALINMVHDSCNELFSHYQRIKEETLRVNDWAKKWGKKDIETRLRKEKGEFEIWMNRINQIKLEFKQACLILTDRLENYTVSYYEYTPITFDQYQELKSSGSTGNANSFSIRISKVGDRRDEILHTFMFRYFRNFKRYPKESDVIPLELNYFDSDTRSFRLVNQFDWSEKVTLRSLYIRSNGNLVKRTYDSDEWDHETDNPNLPETVKMFFDEILERFIGLR